MTGDIDKGDFASVSFKGAGACYRCFNTARTVAQGCVAAGGYVGLYMMNSGDPSWIRIMNSGSRTTYNAWQFAGSGGAISESTYKSLVRVLIITANHRRRLS